MSETERALCDNVEEGDIERNIVEGPPASGCSEDSERLDGYLNFQQENNMQKTT